MIKLNTLIIALITLFSLNIGCNQNLTSKQKDTILIKANTGTTNEWKDTPYKLNVVYFIPKGVDSVPGYNQRISNILLDAQEFFAQNLDREGFGRSSFGLALKNDSLIDIITIHGQKGKTSYEYEGGYVNVQAELEAYYEKNPSKKYSEHYLVILPSISGNPMEPGGVPFYGTGKYCYALDYEYLDVKYLGQNNQFGMLATKWIGGMIHELGHGLNCPHNYGTVSSNEKYGTALMGAGNYTYGKLPTFITATSAAIFKNSQTFSQSERTDWYEDFKLTVNDIHAELIKNKIIIKGKFSSDKTIDYIGAYFDQYPYAVNLDYDAITFGVKPINNDSLYIECPLSEFKSLEGNYELRINFIAQNGLIKTSSFQINFKNKIPDLSQVYRIPMNDRKNWQIITYSSTQSDTPIANIVDGDESSIWHSTWYPYETPHPHYFVIDRKVNTPYNYVNIFNRNNINGAVKNFKLYTSEDGIQWTLVGSYTSPKIAGANYIDLGKKINGRYIKYESINSHDDIKYTHMAEFDVFLK